MGALRALGAVCALVCAAFSSAASAQSVERWRPLAAEAAARFGLPVEWVVSVIEAESGGRTEIGGRPTTSHAGAMGLMQIMPGTWSDLRSTHSLGGDPHDPRDNIVAGTAYLRRMYDRFGFPGLFAAYNAGPRRYGEYVSRGRPLPRETRDYVAKILGRGGAASTALPGSYAAVPLAARAPSRLLFARPSAAAVTMDATGSEDAAIAAADRPARSADPIFLVRRDAAAARE